MKDKKNNSVSLIDMINNDTDRPSFLSRRVVIELGMIHNVIPWIKNIIICDIDGTIADCEHRLHHVDGATKNWDMFFSQMSDDILRSDIYDRVIDDSIVNNADIMLVTGRPSKYREETENWLKRNGVEYMHLFMRSQNDRRPDTVVKQEIYDKYLKHYNVIRVYDDRPSVIDMWKSNNLDVVDVGYGVEF